VSSVTIKAEFYEASDDGIWLLANVRSNADTFTMAGKDMNYLIEKPGVWTKTMSNTGEQRVILQQTVPIAAIQGVPKEAIVTSPYYAAVVTASPAIMPVIAFSALHPSLTTKSVAMNVTLSYKCHFYQRLTVANS
jgi:hypothetical protein